MAKRQTPMLRQYRRLKARYPDALILYRLGDFYELFEEDAKLAARELDLVLTSRRFSKQVRLPMCGLPYRSLTQYVARLIEKGHKVAVAEQLEDARKAKGLIKRDVVRVITPGTVVEGDLLCEDQENYLVTLAPGKRGYGLALLDLSTGEFAATQTPQLSALVEELHRLKPSELVLPDELGDEGLSQALQTIHPARRSPLPQAEFAPSAAAERLKRHFEVASLEACGCADLPLATAAAGATLAYLQTSQLTPGLDQDDEPEGYLAHVRRLVTYDLGATMHLDQTTRRNLELTCTLRDGRVEGSLLGVLDQTLTAMGARLLRRWINQPLLDLEAIQTRLDAVEELHGNAFLRADLGKILKGLHDVERLVGRIGFGSANGRDLAALKWALQRLPRLKARLAQAQSAHLSQLAQLDEHSQVLELIDRALVERPPALIKEGGLIRSGYREELDDLRAQAQAGRDWLTEYEAKQRERFGVDNLRVRYNQVLGFYVEITKSKLKQISLPDEYERRATVTHAERFITPELRQQEATILSAEDRAKEVEYELFVALRRQVAGHAATLSQVARALAELDTLIALAETAAVRGYVKPTVSADARIDIRQGRHPVVEELLPDGERFVPNDARLDADGQRLLIITGPNMAGKSVYIRQVALITLMAQMGGFVPAESAHVGLADRIFVRAGASDDISQGRSTFLVEMSETGYILSHATSRSLIVLDEVGRGTSTYDGVGLAWAVGEHLHDQLGARTLFATHFHELTELGERLPGARNYTLAVKERGDQVIFLRQVVPGGADRSYGIHVARLAGLPEAVVGRAEAVMQHLEKVESETVVEDKTADKSLEHRQPELAETRAPYHAERNEIVWQAARELFGLDIANLTPVQALVWLNQWQGRLREQEGSE